MKRTRIIARLDVKGPNVVKGIQLEGLRVVGNPNQLARKYYQDGADELLYIDIVASLYNRNNLTHIIEETTKHGFFVPITVGGGIRSLEDIKTILRSGADKVAINTAAVKNPDLLREASRIFGSSTIVLSIEAKKTGPGKWEAYTDNGREKTGLDVVTWAQHAVRLGVGEILLTSVDRDGTKLGFDLELVKAVTDVVLVPVVISGGAGTLSHLEECLQDKKIDGIALGTLLHYNQTTIPQLKAFLINRFDGRINPQDERNYTVSNFLNANVSIVDYGLCNLRSVRNAFEWLGATVRFVSTHEEIKEADSLVLPGVGAFQEGMRNLKERGLDVAIKEYVKGGKPFLGICLGMQLLMDRSYEFGEHAGLGLIEGEVIRFKEDPALVVEGYSIPHVGWNSIEPDRDWKGTILEDVTPGSGAYFVHSYCVRPKSDQYVLAKTRYFDQEFCSVLKKENIYGCQFHPEKSGQTGLGILKGFLQFVTSTPSLPRF